MNIQKNNILVLLFLLIINILSASDDPSWVYLRRAEILKDKGDYSNALITARKSREVYITEKLSGMKDSLRDKYPDRIEYEINKLLLKEEKRIKSDDDYPQYHELLGDIFILTNFLEEAEKEYKTALDQKKFFEYLDKELEVQYKLADVFNKQGQYELEDLTYRDIVSGLYQMKQKDYWNRIKHNIKKDQTLKHVFKIYRIDGVKYLKALYKIGRRSAVQLQKDDAVFFLSTAAIVWMTYYDMILKKMFVNFQYDGPSDFINHITDNTVSEYVAIENYIINEIMFYIGYIYFVNKDYDISDFYFDLAKIFSVEAESKEEMTGRINYLLNNKDYKITFNEILD